MGNYFCKREEIVNSNLQSSGYFCRASRVWISAKKLKIIASVKFSELYICAHCLKKGWHYCKSDDVPCQKLMQLKHKNCFLALINFTFQNNRYGSGQIWHCPEAVWGHFKGQQPKQVLYHAWIPTSWAIE